MRIDWVVKTIGEFGEFYWSKYGIRTKETTRALATDSWKRALSAFLEGYAFERQGRSPYYPQAARAAIRTYHGAIPGDKFVRSVWQEFLRLIKAPPSGKGANVSNNPLAPPYGGQDSITSLVCTLGDSDYNIIKWAKEGLEGGGIGVVFGKLRNVRGLGPKITAFFLRDIAAAFEMDELNMRPASYLQPIDRWTWRGAQVLAESMNREILVDERESAEVIVEASRMADIRPSMVNTGLWMLGAEFAGEKGGFREALKGRKELSAYLKDLRKYYQGRVQFLDRVLSVD